MSRFISLAVVLAIVSSVNIGNAAGPAGNWTWVSPLHSGHKDTLKLRLDSEGPTLVGLYVDGLTSEEIRLAPAIWHDEIGKIAFAVSRDIGGQTVVMHFVGKLHDDTIVGKCHLEANGQLKTIDWLAKRKK
jgi:hypothetical protein